MRKIFLALACVLALSFPAFAFTDTITSSHNFTAALNEYAVNFSADADITLTLGESFTMTEGMITFSATDYPNLTTLTINGAGYTLTSQQYYRHFEINNPNIDVTFQGLTLDGGSAGGGIRVLNAKSLILNTVTMNNMNRNSGGYVESIIDENGGGLSVFQGTVTEGITLSGITCSGAQATNGGAIYINSSGTSVTFSGGQRYSENNAGENGGAICINEAGSVTFDSSPVFSNNLAGTDGGAIYIKASGVTFANTATFSGNTAGENGGAVYDNSGSVNFSGAVTFTNNTASSGSGGGVYASGTAAFANTATFTGSTAGANGGAVYASGALSFANSATFTNSTAGSNGGAVFTSSTAAFENSATFTSNTADTSGGALYASGMITFTEAPTFTTNTATSGNGGAIYSGGGVTMANSGTFTGNTAPKGNGGAVYVYSGTAAFTGVLFGSATINGNSAHNGGAVSVASTGTATFDTTNFSQNSADIYGGAIHSAGTVRVNEGTSFTNTNKAQRGGAIHVEGGASYLAGTVTFTENYSTADGGALSVYGGRIEAADEGRYTFTKNTADTNGGALSLSGNGAAYLAGYFLFEKNASNLRGGAIYTEGRSSISAENAYSIFEENTASSLANTVDPSRTISEGLGGAVYISGSGGASMGDTDFTQNTAPFGGALYVDTGNLTFSGGISFDTNNAYSGGAVYAAGGTLTFDGDTLFKRNYAQDNGGALMTSGDYAVVYFNAPSSFTDNKANNDKGDFGSGGAAWLGSGGSPFRSSASFVNNETLGQNTTASATGDGGALYIAFEGTFTINAASGYTFEGNKAYRHGGAIYTETADIVIQNVNISGDNRALYGDGGVIWSGGGHSVTIENTTVTSSRPTQQKALNGGVIYIDNDGKLNIGSETPIVPADPSQDAYLGAVNFSNISVTEQGGVIYAAENVTLNIINATFNNNRSNEDGGVIYIAKNSAMIINGATFSNNNAGGGGGVIFAEITNSTITNAYFLNNSSEGTVPDNMGGGAVHLAGECSTGITLSTFSNNTCSKGPGGAVFADGQISIGTSNFINNRVEAGGGGGAVYINQTQGSGRFVANSCMFTGNTAKPESNNNVRGGALYLHVDIAEVDKCTFTKNSINGSSTARGGALYMNTTDEDQASKISNSTFTENVTYGNTTGGGAICLNGSSLGISVISCTITKDNTASDGSAAKGYGGGIYIEGSTITITGTILVGNIASGGGRDIWVNNGTVTSAGYNRIGIYGKGSGNTSWKETVTGATTDREDEEGSWTTQLFFGENDLDVNEATNTSGVVIAYPPLIGADRTGTEQVYLLTLMLDESDSLPADDLATNAIPNSRQYDFPQYDERGISRWNTEGVNLDVGAIISKVGRIIPPDSPIEGNVISSVMISGIPNSLRSVGQTASLIAMVFYTNGKTNYGGPASEGFEEVIWSSSAPSIVSVDQSGNIVALRTTYTPDYATPGSVTIMVQTKRVGVNNTYATDARAVRVTEDSGMLNVSPAFYNELSDYVYGIFEYDLSLMLAKGNPATVSAAEFQNNFKAVWQADDVSQVTELTNSTPTFTTATAYSNTEGMRAVKNAGVNINFLGRGNGQLFPLVYSWTFTGEQIKSILGYDLSNETINAELADKIFTPLRIDFQGLNRVWPVVGAGGVKASDAMSSGALVLTKADGNRGLLVELTAYLANVAATGNNDGAQLVRSAGSEALLVVPDGMNDGAINGIMWMAIKGSSNATPGQATPGTTNNTPSGGTTTPGTTNETTNTTPGGNTPTTNDGETSTSDNGESSGGGGGGCEAVSVGLLGLVLLLKRRK